MGRGESSKNCKHPIAFTGLAIPNRGERDGLKLPSPSKSEALVFFSLGLLLGIKFHGNRLFPCWCQTKHGIRNGFRFIPLQCIKQAISVASKIIYWNYIVMMQLLDGQHLMLFVVPVPSSTVFILQSCVLLQIWFRVAINRFASSQNLNGHFILAFWEVLWLYVGSFLVCNHVLCCKYGNCRCRSQFLPMVITGWPAPTHMDYCVYAIYLLCFRGISKSSVLNFC